MSVAVITPNKMNMKNRNWCTSKREEHMRMPHLKKSKKNLIFFRIYKFLIKYLEIVLLDSISFHLYESADKGSLLFLKKVFAKSGATI